MLIYSFVMKILLPFHVLLVTRMCLSVMALLSLEANSHPSLFPSNFFFGTASSSYQFEGAFLSDGKGLNNWDIFSHGAGNILDGSNGDIAVDHYHRYLEDLDLMEYLGVNSYRFSISWTRILPSKSHFSSKESSFNSTQQVSLLFHGEYIEICLGITTTNVISQSEGRYGKVNKAGIKHYNKLIDALLHKGINPFVSLTHYDIPQELEDRYEAWLSPKIRDDFRYYADVCFKYFGDRVKYWVTLNEPNVVAIRGYRSGIYPPSRCSALFGNCSIGDSEKEPFIAAHNMILSHAAAVHTYRTKYQKAQGGSIGIVINAIWYEPITNSLEDKAAAERAQSFYMNWFLDPIMFGRYPPEMQKVVISQLPSSSISDLNKMKNGADFIGINQYTSFYAKDCIYSTCEQGPGVSWSEGCFLRTAIKDGIPIGEPTAVDWLHVYPQGMEKVVTYVKNRYNNTPIFITENGFGDLNNPNSSIEDFLGDFRRVEFMDKYWDSLAIAIRKGADVRGYFAWSLLDNFEWISGYTIRFGLYHVDYATLKRTPKLSAAWFKQLISDHKNHANS